MQFDGLISHTNPVLPPCIEVPRSEALLDAVSSVKPINVLQLHPLSFILLSVHSKPSECLRHHHL